MRVNKAKPRLTIHKNTRDQRKAKATRKNLISDAKDLAKTQNISGYAIVVWDDDLSADAAWDSGGKIPGIVMPEYSKQILSRRINQNDTNDIIDMRFE